MEKKASDKKKYEKKSMLDKAREIIACNKELLLRIESAPDSTQGDFNYMFEILKKKTRCSICGGAGHTEFRCGNYFIMKDLVSGPSFSHLKPAYLVFVSKLFLDLKVKSYDMSVAKAIELVNVRGNDAMDDDEVERAEY